jgi:toxin ParE1/3/4
VALLRLSRRAEADLLGISDHTLQAWGEDQAFRYIDALESFCRLLADNPALGRSCDDIRRGLRRMESGQHVVFYRKVAGGILVSRILHRRMLPERYDMDDDDDGS